MPLPPARLAGGGPRQTERSNFSDMTGAMYAAIAGLRTHMQNLNVIGNNVANVNTYGYKAARSVFRTSIYTTLTGGSDGTAVAGGRNPSQIGYGANMGSVSIDVSTGNYAVTGKPTDVMIDGDGFFLVGNKSIAQNFQGNQSDVSALTSLTLTRVGDFDFGADGYLADGRGNVVYGFLCVGVADEAYLATDAGKASGAKLGDPIFSDQLVPLRKPRVWKDETGAMHIGYPRPAGGIQEGNGKKPGDADYIPGDVKKDDFAPPTGWKEKDPHLLDYGAYKDADGNVVESQYTMAQFSNITIDNATGMITASSVDTGEIVTIGCLAVGTVDNPNGVSQIGNSYYQAGPGSGNLLVNTLGGASKNMGVNYVNGSLVTNPGNGGKPGSVNMAANADNAVEGCRIATGGSSGFISGGLEMSKSDLAQEIANMITTQRGYQANTRIITVTDSMLEELVNMKR